LPEEKPDKTPALFQRARHGLAWLKANRKRFFWWWITYQAIKGILTLSLIWIPLFMLWMGLRGD